MRILLVGCTGFLGKALIYRILKTTNHTIFLAMRPKNNKNIKERMENILKDFNLDGYRRRIKPIEVKYDEERNIHIKQSDMKIVKKSDILVNALADVKFNRTLRKAVLNNTVTVMKWLELFKTFESPGKYIYVSSAYVNFDIKNEGIIEEKIYEENMDGGNLIKILAGEQIDFKPYTNTYLYSKQLAEILLLEKREKIKLHIIRPSTIIPAVKYPYVGWGTIQTLNYIFFGIATGIVPCWNISIDDIYRYNINTVPVDIAAKDCIKCFQDPTDFLIRHSCLTGNNEFAITYELFYMLTLTAYQYFERHPLRLQDRTFKPYYPFYMKDVSYIKIVFFVLCYIYYCFRGNRRFFQTLKTSWKLTRNFNTHMPTFVSKKLIFKRKDKQKWFYKNFNAEKSYLSFIRNIGHFIEKNNELMKILVLC